MGFLFDNCLTNEIMDRGERITDRVITPNYERNFRMSASLSRRKGFGWAVAALVVFAPVCFADEPKAPAAAQGIEGIWEGSLRIQTVELRLAFKISKETDGGLSATMDSVDQGAKNIPVDEVAFADGTLTIKMPKLQANYSGK